MHFVRRLLLLAFVLAVTPTRSHAQFPYGEWGDAPEGWAAYWTLPLVAVGGYFPTCSGGAAIGGGFIFHTPNAPFFNCTNGNACFGAGVDFENDGNAGICSEPYDADECYGALDGDAGLTKPTPYTYGPSHQIIPCSGLPPTSLGDVCTMARWGDDIDISISNNFNFGGPGLPAFLNVMVDWNHDGEWSPWPAGPSECGPVTPEHLIKNMQIPIDFHGLLSDLGLADFTIGPDSGLTWVRFSITSAPIDYPYVSPFIVELGETEDYMIHISRPQGPPELGDAPYGVMAYPPGGAIGKFPTCQATPGRVLHELGGGLYMGPSVDSEFDGNHDDCGFTLYDNDECFQDGDAGLVVPRPWTINSTTLAYTSCGAPASSIGTACQPIVWGTQLDMQVTNSLATDAYLNMLVDWDRSGEWDFYDLTCTGGSSIRERTITNLVVPGGYSGLLSGLAPPVFNAGQPGFAWARFTLSNIPAPLQWRGGGDMGTGETEDYLLRVAGSLLDVEDASGLGAVREPWPNPARGSVRLGYELAEQSEVGVAVYDVNGRLVLDLGTEVRPAGSHQAEWNGLNSRGQHAATGAYYIHVRIDTHVFKRRVVLLH